MESQSNVNTARAAQYLGSLCKHFGHRVPVELNGNTGAITFPFGSCELNASDTVLKMSVTANTQENLDKAVQVITDHLERFAFRENPEITWQAA